MRLQVAEKLNNALSKQIENEEQVVYILSKIRKLLEWENAKEKYKVLNFYCNWILHNRIDKTEPVSEILREFIESKEKRYKLVFHQEFLKEFNKFLSDYQLPKMSEDNLRCFMEGLNNSISETPVEIVLKTKYRVILRNPQSKQLFYELVLLKEE